MAHEHRGRTNGVPERFLPREIESPSNPPNAGQERLIPPEQLENLRLTDSLKSSAGEFQYHFADSKNLLPQ